METEGIICEICGMLIEKNLYAKHMKNGHRDKRKNRCELCGKEFSSVYNLQYHMAHHINARSFSCHKCPRAYNTAADLAQHQWTHENRDFLKCDQCNASFSVRRQLKIHMKTHLPQNQTKKKRKMSRGTTECPICHIHFVSLSDHNRIVHLQLRRFECILCGKAFGRKSGLDRHTLVVHQKVKNFKCEFEECGKAFGERSLMERHMKIHTEKYKIAQRMKIHKYKNLLYCSFCKKPYEDIKNHYDSVHSDLKHKCEFCHKRFSKPSSLSIHVKVFHKQEKNYFCDFCPNKGFPEKSQLRRHIQRHRKFEVRGEEDGSHGEAISSKNLSCETQIFKNHVGFSENSSLETFKPRENSSNIEEILLVVDDAGPSDDEISRNSNFEIQSFSEDDGFKKSENKTTEKNLHKNPSDLFEPEVIINYKKSEKQQNLTSTTPNDQTCPICHRTFAKTQFLKLHIDAIHNNVFHECEVCGKKFSFRRAKDRHVKVVHNNERLFKCSHCDKSFGMKTQLRDHISLQHSTNPEENMKYYCESCEKSFSSGSALRQHFKGVHQNIKQKRPEFYRCRFCREQLPNKYQKAKHQAQVHQDGAKPMRSCGVCAAEFKLFENFKEHVTHHESENLKICLTCGESFENSEILKIHVDAEHRHIRTELRRLICDLCGHKVFTKPQLKVHMRKHMKEADFYVCDVCGQSYKFFAPFLYHKKMHEGRRDFVCTECGKEFIQKQVFDVHMRTHTLEKPFKCSVCEKSFASKPVLNTHLQTHKSTRKIYSCRECNLIFKDSKQSRNHDDKIHPDRRPFRCPHCEETFKYDHLRKIHLRFRHKPNEPTYDDFGVPQELEGYHLLV